MKLDLKDKKILYELDFEARRSLKQIGKKVGLPAEVVYYRIKNLEKEKIITNYMIMLDLAKIGILQFKLYFKFEDFTKDFESSFIKFLKGKKEVKWLVSCFGDWDMMIAIETENISGFNKIRDEIYKKCSKNLIRSSMSNLVEAVTYRRYYLVDKKGLLTEEAIIMGKQDKIEIDDVDLRILKKLAENGRDSVVEIAKKLKLTPRIVSYRIKQLRKEKIILGFKIAINYEKLGYKFFKSFIQLKNNDEKRIKDFINYCKINPNIIHHVKVSGDWYFEPEFEVKNNEEFFEILREIRDKFSDIIKDISSVMIIKEHKFSYF